MRRFSILTIHDVRICLRTVVVFAAALLLTAGCATTPLLLPYHTPPGASYVAEVIGLSSGKASRVEILGSGELYEMLLASGISDDQIADGSIERGRVYCCGGPQEGGGVTVFYVPHGMSLTPGDLVEVKAGEPKEANKAVRVNVVTRVVLNHAGRSRNASCRWDPPDERLWQRVIYCDWMMAKGWVKERGTGGLWYKPDEPRP